MVDIIIHIVSETKRKTRSVVQDWDVEDYQVHMNNGSYEEEHAIHKPFPLLSDKAF